MSTVLHRGASYTLRIEVTGEEKPAGVTAHFRIARSAQDPALVEVNASDITLEEDPIVYVVPISAEQTKSLKAGRVYYRELYELNNGVRNVISFASDVIVLGSQLAKED
jgi:hypothetical protein